MNKPLAILLSILITGLLFNLYYISNSTSESKAILISRVIDGDTFEDSQGIIYRLANINTLEKSDPRSKDSTAYLSQLINKSVQVEILGKEKYGRTLARIYHDNQYINLELVRLGLATTFLVDNAELKKFNEAEKEAVKNKFGIWKNAETNDCIKLNLDYKEEILIITSKCGPIDSRGWLVRDESRKQYIFNSFLNTTLKLNSGIGSENNSNLFWQSKTAIWNNDRDTLYLFNRSNSLIYYYKYGY